MLLVRHFALCVASGFALGAAIPLVLYLEAALRSLRAWQYLTYASSHPERVVEYLLHLAKGGAM